MPVIADMLSLIPYRESGMGLMDEQLDAFNSVDWSSFSGPSGGVPHDLSKVPRALRMLSEATTAEEASEASTHLLYTIGNNHAGALYPAAVAAMPFVIAIARRTELVWASYAALDVLVDIVSCLGPDEGCNVVVRPNGTAVGLMYAVFEPIRQAENEFRLLANESLPQQLRGILGELLDLLEQLEPEEGKALDYRYDLGVLLDDCRQYLRENPDPSALEWLQRDLLHRGHDPHLVDSAIDAWNRRLRDR